jgi:HAD superfamily hydrolase (TIGR01509 family)
MMFQAVLFDWDGTLADTKAFVVTAFQRVLRNKGWEAPNDVIERCMGIGPRNTLKEALCAIDVAFDDDLIHRLEAEKVAAQLASTSSVRLFDGARSLLDALHGKVKTALATMSNLAVIDQLLAEMGIGGYFDLVLTFDDIQRPKPDPEVFLACAARLRCAPEACVVVEDSVFGVEAAKAAHMRCIAIPSGAYSREELMAQGADLVVPSLTATRELLAFILPA